MEQGKLEFLAQTLDDIRHQNGVEFWRARELSPILGYPKFEDFKPVISRAKQACQKSGGNLADHFQEINIKIDSMDLSDIKLTRYACYLITINGDPHKEQIAFAQAYFVTQTRTVELLQQRMAELERIDAREKLKITEKEFSDMAFTRNVDGRGIAEIRAKGDEALFGATTDEMKQKLRIEPKTQPLADYLPNVTLKAKDLATAMTIEKTRKNNLSGKESIKNEHVVNNQNVRGALINTGIHPENLPPAEDIKKIEAKHRKEMKELQTKHKKELDQVSKKLNS